MIGLSLDLKVTIGRKGYVPAMDDLKSLFRSIFEDSKLRGVAGKITATECDAALNDIIRPTMRAAAEEIKLDRVRFETDNHEPFIVVIGDYDPYDEIRFMCQANVLAVRVQLAGQNPMIDKVMLSDISTKLIASKIDRFLRQSLRLPTRRDST